MARASWWDEKDDRESAWRATGGIGGNFWGNLWGTAPMPDRENIPEPTELLKDLKRIVRTGLKVSALTNLPAISSLSIVQATGRGSSRPIDVAIDIEAAVTEAVEKLGDGPTGEAAQLLLGMTPRSRGLLVKDRRALAGEIIGVEPETFRKEWETRVLSEVADELYKLEAERRIPVRVKRGRAKGAILDDLRSGSGGKSLDRREAEARLWALMYELRAELLAVARLQDEKPGSDAWEEPALTALWLYGRFLDAYARFIDQFGTALVMAGNEVTVDEAVSLLGWRPPLDEAAAACLRLKLIVADSARPTPLLGVDPELRTIQNRWLSWLSSSGTAAERGFVR